MAIWLKRELLEQWVESGLLVNVAAAIGQMAEDTSSLEQVSLLTFSRWGCLSLCPHTFEVASYLEKAL